MRASPPPLLLHVRCFVLTVPPPHFLPCPLHACAPREQGYRDFNLCVELTLAGGKKHIVEVQLNHEKVLLAKKGAHKFYETVRETLPRLCQQGGGAVDADELEAFIVGQLNSSSLDAAVKVLVDKAGGLMLYARLLEQSLEETNGNDGDAKVDFGALTALPGGLDDMYTTNFERTFPEGDGGAAWEAARRLLEAIVASRELVPVALLGAAERAVLAAVSLLLPVRRIDGFDRVGVLHKSVKDWLTDAGRAGRFFVEDRKSVV